MSWKLFADRKIRICISLSFALFIVAVYSGAFLLRYGTPSEVPFYEVRALTEYCCVATLILAILIGAYGFSYLHSMKKVDFFHSLPVSSERRFRVLYTNACSVFFAGIILSIAISLIFIASSGGLAPVFLAKLGLALVLTALFFLSILNITVYAFTLSGNTVIAILIDIILIF